MKTKNTDPLVIAVVLMTLFTLSACQPVEPATEAGTPGSPSQMAVLHGKVVFGPLQPVEQKDAPTPETPPELFEGRMVLIYRPDGETLVTEAAVQSDGTYRIEIEPGEYVIGFTLVSIERSENVPAAVTLNAGQVLEFDISVDTGIR